MGDWNMQPAQLRRLIVRWALPLSLVPVRGSAGTYHGYRRQGGRFFTTAIDHILVNAAGMHSLYHAVVDRHLDMSCHWPLVARVREVSCVPASDDGFVRPRIIGRKLKDVSQAVATHNRWTPLLDALAAEDCDLGTLVTQFHAVSHAVAGDLECRVTRAPRARAYHRLSKDTKAKIRRRRKLAADMRRARPGDLPRLSASWRDAAAEAKAGVRSDNARAWLDFVSAGSTLLRQHKSAAFWRFVRQLTGSGRAERRAHPVKDAHGRLQTDPDGIRAAVGAHYATLVQDPGAMTEREWRQACPLPKGPRLPGINHQVTWSELHICLGLLKGGKAAGEDGVPPELFKAALEDGPGEEPQTPLGKVLLALARRVWLEPDGAPELRSALVCSIPKPGDLTELDNYRGISLIPVVLKLVTRILARRLSEGLQSRGVLVREQAGFLSREECLGQVVSLYEIAQRRKLKLGKATYAAFIDFRKAFDTVPHGALFHKLWSVGVRGASLRFIRRLYASSTIKVLVGSQCTGDIRQEKGVRQGDPLSPILFDVFINDILEGIDGVQVPGLEAIPGCPDTVPGLLFADDAVGVASKPTRLHRLLGAVGAWADRWGMRVNASKCGIMVLMDEGKHARAKEGPWVLQGQPVPVVDTYKYLGVTLDVNTDLRVVVAHRADQARKALFVHRPMLQSRSIPLHIRVLALKALIYPSLVHGGELVGLRDEKLYSPLQRLLKMGLSWVAQGAGKASAACGALMREFGVAPIVAHVGAAKARALAKYPTLRTWVAPLCASSARTRQRTWVTGGRGLITRILAGEDSPSDPVLLSKLVRQKRWAALEHRDRSVGVTRFLSSGFGHTSMYVKLSAHHPALATGMAWLCRVRVNCFWTANRAAAAGLIPAVFRTQCPSCGRRVRDDLTHLLLRCRKYNSQRSLFLTAPLAALRAWAGECDITDLTDDESVALLLGGGVRGTPPSRAIWLGVGPQGDSRSPAMCGVANYMRVVMPRHATAIWALKPAPRADAPHGVGQHSQSVHP
jgi:hypothetical protein